MTADGDNARAAGALPKARVARNWKTWAFWIVPVAAAMLAGYFVYTEEFDKGPTITIYFSDAAGLQAEKTSLKYRGVEIGTVQHISLTDDQRRAKVTVSLKRNGRNVARADSEFWIVEPRIGLNEIKGLGTVVSGDYITVRPGTGKERHTFNGLDSPPPPEKEEKGLLIVLVSDRMGSVKKHSSVMYRGVEVGEVWDQQLGPDSQVVLITVNIRKKFAPLVRMNSVFWNAGGINFNLGLSGLDVSAQSATALLEGGIDFATPDTRQKQAEDGTAFRLYDKPKDVWLTWSPAIKLAAVPANGPVDGGPGGVEK